MQRSRTARFAAIVFGLVSLSGMCFAQGSRGSITGRITDPQNSVVPGASIIVKSVLNCGVTKTATNQTGYYEVNFLDPGTYSVSAEAPGFALAWNSGRFAPSTGGRQPLGLITNVQAPARSGR